MKFPSAHASQLLETVLRRTSFVDRLRGNVVRREALEKLAALGEPAVIPALLPLIATGDDLGREAAHTVTMLWTGVHAPELAWIDQQARNYLWPYGGTHGTWTRLAPTAVPRLARLYAHDPILLGLLACHPNGHVREAAVRELGAVTGGGEIPFLALRANDWVWPVAERAAELLTRRLVPDNREAVVMAFPFLARMVSQRRRDHRRLADAVERVVRSDGGQALLARLGEFDVWVRRQAYGLLLPDAITTESPAARAALQDADPVVRSRVVRRLSETADGDAAARVFEHVATKDSVPAVRAEALAALAERRAGSAMRLVPDALLDSGATVRRLARFLVAKLGVPVVPRDVYVASLQASQPRQLAAAIDGLGESGTQADADLVLSFAGHAVPRVRRAVLRASAALAPPRSVERAMEALADPAPSVRRSARQILLAHRRHVDFTAVWERVRTLSDPVARRGALAVLARASKWEAVLFLLQALGDPDAEVRRRAAELLDSWTKDYNRSQARPSQQQLDRVRALLEEHADQVSLRAARLLAFTVESVVVPDSG